MSNTVVFIDSRVPDYATIIAALPAGTEWVVLDAHSDGIQQIAAALAGRTDLDAIRLISHGSPGSLQLGTTVLTADNLADYAGELHAIGSALSETGDLLLYGCDVGAGTLGETFMAALSQHTGADIAASNDTTGSGGNWTLERNTGPIAAPALAVGNYAATLGNHIGTSGNDLRNREIIT